MTERVPAEVFPPGEFVRDELEARGWSQADLAEILGRPPRLVNELIAGKRGITPETARGLAAAFGTEPQFWMNLESAYQLSRVRAESDVVERRARLFAKVPLKEIVRRHWVEPTDNIELMEQRVASFLDIPSIEATPQFAAAARAAVAPTTAHWAWVCRARHLARGTVVARFTKASVDQACAKLRPLLLSAQEVRKVPAVLAECGVRMVVVEALPGTRIDGACFWLDNANPVIALSLRYDRVDAFWFTLMHELGHVRAGDGRGTDEFPIDTDLVGEHAVKPAEKSARERAADEFAQEFLVPTKDVRDFIARVRPLYSKARIAGFAERMRVHPGIVVGRLHFLEEIHYSHSRDTLEKVRDRVIATAITDG